MTITPSGSWSWQNRHCRSIRNDRNSREPVWLCRNQVRKSVNRSTNQFCTTGGSLGWTGNILRNILSARLRLGCSAAYGAAWKGNILGNILRRGWRLGAARLNGSNMARVEVTRLQPLERVAETGQTVQNIQVARVAHPGVRLSWFLRKRVRMDDLYTLEWSKLVFDNFENSDISQKHFCFSDERGSDTNCWWEKPLVVALKHWEGIKHTVLLQEHKLTIT